MNTLELQKELTFEEVKHFFSKCNEYIIEESGNNIKITLQITKDVTYDENFEPIFKYEYVDNLVYKPCYQTLIRTINNLASLANLKK